MEHNLAALGEDSFERHGDYESLMFDGRGRRSGELFERGRRLAGGLRNLGVSPGDRVAVMLPNCPEVGISYGALWRAGAAITPVIFLLPPPELRYVLEHSRARAIITAPELLGAVLAATEGLETLQWVISTGAGEAGNGKVVPLASLEDAEPSGIVPRDDHDLAARCTRAGRPAAPRASCSRTRTSGAAASPRRSRPGSPTSGGTSCRCRCRTPSA